MTHEEIIAGTLDWCNEIRAKENKEPISRLPKGRAGDPMTCPCGRATGKWVTTNTFYDAKDTNEVDYASARNLPSIVRKFVHLLDSGALPQYELTRKNPS